MITYPIAASFALFGTGEVSASAWALLCSVLSVLVVYRLGTVLHDRTVGLIAALLCAFYPLEVINGTRILSDVQVGLFASIALLLFVEAMRRGTVAMFALSGAATACAYLANARGTPRFRGDCRLRAPHGCAPQDQMGRASVDCRWICGDLQR